MEFSKEELEIISFSLIERQTRMMSDAEAYKKLGNPEAQMDCINEWRKANKLYEKVRSLVRSLK